MKNKRIAVLMVSVGGGLKIPLYTGDRIKACEQKDRKVYIWRPLGEDGKTLDLTRTKRGPRGERHLRKSFFEALRLSDNLELIQGGEYVIRIKNPDKKPVIGKKDEETKKVLIGKRRPLLRLPLRGLPPRWC